MKFSLTSLIVALSAVSTVYAQGALIGYPPSGTTVSAGSNITVEIDRPNSLSSSTEVAVVIGLISCPTSPCRPVTDGVGTVLYNGPYHPALPPAGSGKPPHQNFTVTVPSDFPTGTAQLGVVHVTLIGVRLHQSKFRFSN
ncbi:hypothetical protein H0H92_016087 [Tricholoma furcatifolium]|nr:hypothetical protein H0H92_016087 [Tricholoma furcatifolium]